MAVKMILTQIMKNEEHVARRMLDSIKPIVDGICVVDTGSTDNSIKIVKQWGEENQIETYVFEKEFDNFENCRNHSIEKAEEIFGNRKDGDTYYGFWLDFDEQIVIEPSFKKNKLDKDLYMFNTYINTMKYTRNELYKLNGNIKFYGPVHEFIVPKDKNKPMTSGLCEGIKVIVKMDGGSWKEETAKKYRKHAELLENYIDNKDRDPRWIFYTAQSYHDSACIKDNEYENKERMRRAIKYYKERVEISGGYYEERFYAQYRISTCLYRMGTSWDIVKNELMKAYRIEPLRAEPFKLIIEHYQRNSDWDMAYLYAKFAYDTYHRKDPYPNRVLFLDSNLYEWKLAELYASSCYYTNRKEEAKSIHNKLLEHSRNRSDMFSQEDIIRINKNNTFFNK
jgi:hypothetical protein